MIRSPWGTDGAVGTPFRTSIGPDDPRPRVASDGPPSDGISRRPAIDDRNPVLSGDEGCSSSGWAMPSAAVAGIRTAAFSYTEHADGTVELYDLVGRLGPADPDQLRNLARDADAAATLADLPPGSTR